MISLVLAAALQSSPVVITQSVSHTPQARYVRLSMNVNLYGIDGTADLLVDRRSGRYFEHFKGGPASFYQGFDGTRAWQADVNGTTAVQGNAVDRGTVISWGYLFAFPRAARITGSTVRYPGIPQSATFSLDDSKERIQRFAISNGIVDEVVTFSGYHTFGNGITAPGAIGFTDDNGTWKARVTKIATVNAAASDFAPPRRVNDSSVAGGVTSVPFMMATEIVVPVRINNGPVMHFLIDTGGQNVLTGAAAKRLGLRTEGHGTVGGAGAALIPTSFVTVRSVRIGSAEMRNQPFVVLNTPVFQGMDGELGFELFSRFAARVDYRTNTLTLASSLPGAWKTGAVAIPFSFRSRAPAVEGAIDGIPGLLTVDTGNSGVLDINMPFADKHNLWAYYHAVKPKRGSLAGVGGSVNTSNVLVRRLRLGSVTVKNVYGDLTQATSGIEADPAFAANVGEGVFRNFIFVLDYKNQRLYFAPGGVRDRSGVVLVRHGDRIIVQDVRTHSAMRAGVHAGMTLTALNGKPVTARDFAAVELALEGEPGSTVDLVFDSRKRVKVLLLNYL